MINVSLQTWTHPMVAYRMIKSLTAEGEVSTGPNRTVFHFPDGTSQQIQANAQAIINNYNTLAVVSTATTLNEGDTDPVITCGDAAVSGDSELGYVVLLDGVVYADGDVSVIGGTATLNLVDPIAGVYQVFVFRKTGNFASGRVTITVNEV